MAIPKAAAAKELLARRQSRKDLLRFSEYTHPQWNTGNHHKLICHWLEQIEKNHINRLAIFAPPRHSKTELASVRFPAWYLGKHPDRQVISMTHTALLAEDKGSEVRDLLKDPVYQNVFPGVTLRADSQASGRWRTSAGGIYYAAGFDGQVVGRGAHLLVIDDPHKGREGADSPRMRDKVAQKFFGDLITRLMNPEAILLMMTRWHEDDLAGRLLPPENEWEPIDDSGRVFKAGDWTVLRLRAIETDAAGVERALWSGGNSKRGFPIGRLRKVRDTMVAGGQFREWNAQYLQHPVSEEGTYIKREWFEERYTKDTLPEHLNIYMASDFAVTDKTASPDPDYTEHGVFGEGPDGKIYVLDWWSGQVTPDKWIDQLLEMWDEHKPYCWFGEAGPIRRAVQSIIERRSIERSVFCHTEWLPSVHDKTARGRPFQAWASSKRIVFPESGTRFASGTLVDEIIDQCVSFPTVRHDDKFDVLSLMVSAVDQTHSAIVPRVHSEKKRDRWSNTGLSVVQGWKTV